jgi:signal transduction histidine kinase
MAGAPEPRRLDIDIGAEDDRIRVTFRDTGPGLSADAAHRVFEPFYTTKAMGRGTGLGLAVSFRIVEEHGGLLAVDSRPGEGACFTVELPTKKDES